MDVKSLAKSKRAHSQHHSKKHHSKPTTIKAPILGPGDVSTANKGKEVGEKPHQSQHSKGVLPSNQDRYKEDYDSDLDDQSKSRINPATYGFTPKSKGADYQYLLSEAKLQSEAIISSGSFPSFDDVLSDFTEGFGSLMSARGESILSWTEDDNFIVEDKATATHEASFLSLNLHLLAEQLEKVDISRRLLIEPDFFLAEQPNKENLKDEEAEGDLLLNSFSNMKFCNSSEPKQNDTLLARQEETAFKMESTSVSNKASVLHSRKDSDLFKLNSVAINFDDDLDDLLKETSPSLPQGILSVQSNRAQPRAKGSDFSKPASRMNNFDNNLDDLLLETSLSIKNSQGIPSGYSGHAQSSKMDQVLSKPATVMPNFDDELDDLLKETSTKKSMSVT